MRLWKSLEVARYNAACTENEQEGLKTEEKYDFHVYLKDGSEPLLVKDGYGVSTKTGRFIEIVGDHGDIAIFDAAIVDFIIRKDLDAQVVQCKDCKCASEFQPFTCLCTVSKIRMPLDGFCSLGEVKR